MFDNERKIIYPQLSYVIVGCCFEVHNELGRYSREKLYVESLKKKLISKGLKVLREYQKDGNRLDLLVEDKIIVEAKAKKILKKDDYYQIQRYLQSHNKKLGLLVNFNQPYLRPKRIIRIETDTRKKFQTR